MAEIAAGKIIDAHCHVWTPDTERYPLPAGFASDDFWLPSFTPDDHFEYSRVVGDVRINLVQMTWYGLDHSYILDLIAAHPDRFVGTGIVPGVVDVSLASPDKAMVALSRGGIYAFRIRGGKGARMSFNDWPRWLDHPGYESMFVAGAEHNLALSFLMGTDDIPELDRMCTLHPETPVIIDHMGGVRMVDGEFPEEKVDAVCSMAGHKRVMLKVGPIHAMGDRERGFTDVLPVLRRVVDAFGPERCMWESDSGGPVRLEDPEKDYLASVDVVRKHADFLSESDKEQILFKTAEDFFFNRG